MLEIFHTLHNKKKKAKTKTGSSRKGTRTAQRNLWVHLETWFKVHTMQFRAIPVLSLSNMLIHQ